MPIISGVKYSCEPCMRGHRSSKCTHEDRLLIRVRKPGRPLTACPHLPAGQAGTTTFVDANGARLDDGSDATATGCGCEVTSLAIPKVSSCACSSPGSKNPCGMKNHRTPAKSGIKHESPASASTPGSGYINNDTSGRITKSSGKKRRSVSINGEAMLEFATKHENRENNVLKEIDYRTKATFSNGNGQNMGLQNNNALGHVGAFATDKQLGTHNENEEVHSTGLVDTQYDQANRQWIDEAMQSPNSQGSQPPESSTSTPKGCCKSKAPAATQAPIAAHAPVPNMGTQQMPRFPIAFGFQPQLAQFPPLPAGLENLKPTVTTIYTYPNGYQSFNNPLTPQELALLQAGTLMRSPQIIPTAQSPWNVFQNMQNGSSLLNSTQDNSQQAVQALHQANAPQHNGQETNILINNDQQANVVPNDTHPLHALLPNHNNYQVLNNAEYDCQCGPNCSCLGCAVHPYNASTLNFVKDMQTMIRQQGSKRQKTTSENAGGMPIANPDGSCVSKNEQGDDAEIPSHNNPEHISAPENQQPGYGTNLLEHHQLLTPTSPGFQTSLRADSPMSYISHAGDNVDAFPSVRPHHCRPTAPLPDASPVFTETSPENGTGEEEADGEQRIVSPSAYFHIDYASGSCGLDCQCGDGCECLNCMVHVRNQHENMVSHFDAHSQAVQENRFSNANGIAAQDIGQLDGGNSGVLADAHRGDILSVNHVNNAGFNDHQSFLGVDPNNDESFFDDNNQAFADWMNQ